MRYLLAAVFLLISVTNMAQTPDRKLSRDSVRYYQKRLSTLWRSAQDSMLNSAEYKSILSKLDKRHQQRVVTVELLANVGLYFTDFKHLNARLKSLGQEKLKSTIPSVGASLAIGYPIMTYGFELSSYGSENKSASFKGLHARVFLATNLFPKNKFVLNPQIGYSGSLLKMFIHRPETQTNFNDLFTGQANSVYLTHSQNYLDLAMGFKIRGRGNERFYFQFFRAGYRYGFKEVAWQVKSGNIDNAPKDRNNQFYFQLCLGFDR